MTKSQKAFKRLRKLISQSRGYCLTQAQFATALGITRDAVASVEAGRLEVSQKMKNRITLQYGAIITEDSECPQKYVDYETLSDFKSEDFKEYRGPSVLLQSAILHGTKEALNCWLADLPVKKRVAACSELQDEMDRIFKEHTGKEWKRPSPANHPEETEKTLKLIEKQLTPQPPVDS